MSGTAKRKELESSESGSSTRSEVLLIVPCYNEEANVHNVLQAIQSQKTVYDAVVIDDGSADATAEVAKLSAPVLQHISNLGIGAAVQSGIRYAWHNGYSFCVQVDGDGQHPPSEVDLLLQEYYRKPANIIIGSRFLEKSGFQSSVMRRLGINLISFTFRFLYRQTISDPTSGLRLMDRTAIALFSKNYPYDFPEPISAAVALENGLSIREVPVVMKERGAGVSSIGGLKSLTYMLRVIGYITVTRLSRYL